ncbi:MAG TPA: GAF domain-containing protein [Thermodesulfobacteriota bacterium]|nr:GAF domain-containing protein [Thermodesulfobacteriota bacterium]
MSFLDGVKAFLRAEGAGRSALARPGQLEAQTAMLLEIGRAMSSSMQSVELALKLITEAVTVILGVERSLVFLVDPATGDLVARAGSGLLSEPLLEGLRVPAGAGALARVVQQGEPALVREAAGAGPELQALSRALGASAFLAAPLRVGPRTIGVLTADTRRDRTPFTDADLRLLTVLAQLAAIAEENAALVGRLRAKAERLRALLEVGQALVSTLDLDALLDLVIDKAIELTHASTGSVILVDRPTQTLVIRSARGLSAEARRSLRLKVGEGITGWVAKTGRPLRVPDVTKDPRYVVANENVRSELAVPMVLGEEVIGVINVDHYRLNAFTEEDQELLESLAPLATVAIRNASLVEALRQRSPAP